MKTSKRYLGILADMDGTMNKGDQLIPGASQVYEDLTQRGIRWVFLSNNATVLPRDLAARIRDLGIPVTEDQVVNSALTLIRALKKEQPAARVMVVGEPALARGIMDAGIAAASAPDQTDIVVAAMDRGFNYEKLKNAQAAIRGGALFWATNTDAFLPVANGVLPGAGSIVAAISVAAGRGPDRVFGKPSPDMAYMALDLLELPAESCLIVGDRIDTDMVCARQAGIDFALVLTGATSKEDLDKLNPTPNYVFDSIAELRTLFDL
jgi:HAD superfamily hydrolase (TIGR01457 family)